nr:AbiH family protein [Lactococcus carnosus]
MLLWYNKIDKLFGRDSVDITFLLGNGFDIQCGLKTSYLDFYNHILEKKYSIDLNKEFDEKLISKIDNIIYQEIYESKDNIKNWADLEFQLGVFTKQLKEENQVGRLADKFLEDFEDLWDDLRDYLETIQIQDDIEISEDFSEVLSITMDNFFEGLLSQEYDEINNMLIENTGSPFNYHFISFNYTNSLQKIIKNASDISKINQFNSTSWIQIFDDKIINVHGTVDNLLTLGLNDESQLATDFFDIADLYDLIKPMSLENNREYMRRDAENVIQGSDIIVIFGMSIGSTDKHWWEKIANTLLKNENKKLIIHLYEEKLSSSAPRRKRIRRESKENEFLSLLDSLDLSEEQGLQLRKQMYVVTNSQYIMNVDLGKYLNLDKNKSDNIIDFEAKDIV